MRNLLDTHMFVELASHGIAGLSPKLQKAMEDPSIDLLLSSVSLTEIAIKASVNKLVFSAADVSKAVGDLRIRQIAFEPQHASILFDLPLHHRDPFDRMLIATALAEDLPLWSRDSEFKKYRGLKLIGA